MPVLPQEVTRSAKYTSSSHLGHLGTVAPGPGRVAGREHTGARDSENEYV